MRRTEFCEPEEAPNLVQVLPAHAGMVRSYDRSRQFGEECLAGVVDQDHSAFGRAMTLAMMPLGEGNVERIATASPAIATAAGVRTVPCSASVPATREATKASNPPKNRTTVSHPVPVRADLAQRPPLTWVKGSVGG